MPALQCSRPHLCGSHPFYDTLSWCACGWISGAWDARAGPDKPCLRRSLWAGFEEPGQMGQNEGTGEGSLTDWGCGQQPPCALKLHCPWLSPEGKDQHIAYHFKSSMKNNVRILHGNLKNIAYKLMVVWMCWVKLISQIILPVFTL